MRYPGGKSKYVRFLLSKMPKPALINEYREPMVGGGNLFLAIRALYPQIPVWINDIDEDLVSFWLSLRDQPQQLVAQVLRLKETFQNNGRGLYEHLLEQDPQDGLERAAAFFVLNRISYSGLGRAGGYSEYAFRQRLTDSAVRYLYRVSPLLRGVKITCGDYETALEGVRWRGFVYLDPPYFGNKRSKLYGRGGKHHAEFDHQRLAGAAKRTAAFVMISYDEHEWVEEAYNGWNIEVWEPKYSMANGGAKRTETKRELLLRNYGDAFGGFE